MEKNVVKKPSLAELKEKAGKAFLDVDSIKGGLLEACHHPIEVPPVVIRTDNV